MAGKRPSKAICACAAAFLGACHRIGDVRRCVCRLIVGYDDADVGQGEPDFPLVGSAGDIFGLREGGGSGKHRICG